MMGQREKFTAGPFFWSQHYDIPINYVGHVESWDEIAAEGRHCWKGLRFTLQSQGRTRAIPSAFRDYERLQAELAMETEGLEEEA
jgi:hypothetical protein